MAGDGQLQRAEMIRFGGGRGQSRKSWFRVADVRLAWLAWLVAVSPKCGVGVAGSRPSRGCCNEPRDWNVKVEAHANGFDGTSKKSWRDRGRIVGGSRADRARFLAVEAGG